MVGGGVRWIHGYERKGEIGWFYSSSLLLEGKKLNDRIRQVSLLGGKKTPLPWSKDGLGWGRKGTLPHPDVLWAFKALADTEE